MNVHAALDPSFSQVMGSKSSKLVKDGDNTIIIAVIGLSGAGKSTVKPFAVPVRDRCSQIYKFINSATENTTVEVGHTLKPKTVDIQCVMCRASLDDGGERQILFVETPGFDSDNDAQKISKKLKSWLDDAASRNFKISGILYLHRITDPKLANPPIAHLTLLRALCEQSVKGFPNRVILVTTMWNTGQSIAKGENREKELQKYWDEQSRVLGGVVAQIMRFDPRVSDSAMSTVRALMKQS
ncbi:hypothetical protein NP233_g1926 [Leucocoprinus birnbaumii]|uniref:G domain-containing protein n=1 Tax=Leucocoprinus birnbaumii TaxID=56174 RepID=A0AAD5YUA3_9AGAR|nr:hypothetical protein NP233_g1926 [Leucocoprinus birnbaumii]